MQLNEQTEVKVKEVQQDSIDFKEGIYLCEVDLRFTSFMVLKYSDGFWWQYVSPNIIKNVEGWIGIDFEIKKVLRLLKENAD